MTEDTEEAIPSTPAGAVLQTPLLLSLCHRPLIDACSVLYHYYDTNTIFFFAVIMNSTTLRQLMK